MDPEARFYKEGDIMDYTPTGARVAGQMVQLDNGKAGLVIDAIAANALGAVQVSGIAEAKNAAINGSAGSPVGWDEDGDPVSGDSGSGALTTNLADADFIVGSLFEAMASTDTTAKVVLNEFDPKKPIFAGMTFETVSADKTLDELDCGKALIVTADAKTITLPATASGLGPIAIINGGADAAIAVNISPNSDDKIMGPDIAGTNNKDLINTKTTAKHWDYVIISPDVAGNGWQIHAIRGTWATEG
ncbi:MAG: capsid cement protein [Anaerovoracaceae bacterium]